MKLSIKTILILTCHLVSGISCNNYSQNINQTSTNKTYNLLSFIKALKLDTFDPINSSDLLVRLWYERNQDKPVRELLVLRIMNNDMLIKHYLIEMEPGYGNRIISKKYRVLNFSNRSSEPKSKIISFCTRIVENKSATCKQKERYDGTIFGVEILKNLNYKFRGYKIPFTSNDLLCPDVIEIDQLFQIIRKEFGIFPIKNSTNEYIKY
jgi:hypothetical protein